MRCIILVLLSIAVVTAPVIPALACVGGPDGGSGTEARQDTCCCAASGLACNCGCCGEPESNDAPQAEQVCSCGQKTPQNNEESRAGSGGAEVRLTVRVSTARDEGQQSRGIARATDVPRKYPHPQTRPPLLI